jgi:hypothetical protein
MLRQHAPANPRSNVDEINATVFDISNSVEGYEIERFAINEAGAVTPLNAKQLGRCCYQK